MRLTVTAPFGIEEFPEERTLSFIHSFGLTEVQVVRDFQFKMPPKDILAMLKQHGLRAESYHGDHGPHIHISSDDESHRKTSIEKIRVEAETALALETNCLIVHSSGVKAAYNPTGLIDPFRKSIDELARIGEKLNVRFYIENMPPEFVFGVEAGPLAEMVREVGSEHLGICFDIGHAHLSPLAVDEQIAATQGYIHYIHAHDNDGTADQHRLPFTAGVDWDAAKRALDAIDYQNYLCLEVFETVDVLKEKLTPAWWQRLGDFAGNHHS